MSISRLPRCEFEASWQVNCTALSGGGTRVALHLVESMPALQLNPALSNPVTVPDAKSLERNQVLRFDQVTVRFDDVSALTEVSLSIDAGETIVLFGAAGSGKTVLLKTAIGLICPDAGKVHLFDQDITNLSEKQLYPLRHRAGMLFQEGALFDSLTIEENVAYPLLYQQNQELPESEVQARVKEELEMVGLRDVMEKYPSELSGGMRHRVGIARAAVTRPPLMLYDSPTAGLDPITAYHIMELLIHLRDTVNAASLVVTHRYQDGYLLAHYKYDSGARRLMRTDNPRRPTRFVVLREGRIVFEGTDDEIRASTDPYVAKFTRRSVSAQKRWDRSRDKDLERLRRLYPSRSISPSNG